ncbi:hypothetical protein BB560_001557 [Smittium megazygosporum]|uniref:J domain-containing protein n=1 Tax=Smittium megazygosporum TaxID=133381 RepID=A0A2T9ZH81_9FUNG|nr:hypothetical protein BB560_001557 [Smittium megazygosporum]
MFGLSNSSSEMLFFLLLSTFCFLISTEALSEISNNDSASNSNKKLGANVFFKRATAFLAAGKPSQATLDLRKALESDPSFEPAREKLFEIYISLGDLSSAKKQLENIRKSNPENTNLNKYDQKLQEVSSLSTLVDNYDSSDSRELLSALSQLISLVPRHHEYRLQRAQVYAFLEDYEAAIADLREYLGRMVNKLSSAELSKWFQTLSQLQFFVSGDTVNSIKTIKQCLASDPDNSMCARVFKRMKKDIADYNLVHEKFKSKQYTYCKRTITDDANGGLVNRIQELANSAVLSIFNSTPFRFQNGASKNVKSEPVYELLLIKCKSLINMKQYDLALPVCDASTAIRKTADAMISKAHAIVKKCESSEEQELELDKLPPLFEEIGKLLENSEDVSNTLKSKYQKIKSLHAKLKKLAGRKDYYKILGVKKDASKAEIKKMYRKLAKQYHPDRAYSSAKGKLTPEEAKLQAERKMAELNIAYEILSDDNKRQQFDNGMDPEDPNGGAGPGGYNPFQSQGSPFGFHFDPFSQGHGHQQFVFRSGGFGFNKGNKGQQKGKANGHFGNFEGFFP